MKERGMSMNNRKEIMQLRSGREIDVLVAEQIKGWQIETDEPKLRKLQGYFSRGEERRWWRAPEGGWYYNPPSYSSDITAAWQIVESMNSRGQFLFLSQNYEEYNVAFDEPRTISPDYISEKSVALAICKAALVVAERVQFGVGSPVIAQRAVPAKALA
jgi:Phage ABA sandwich domain